MNRPPMSFFRSVHSALSAYRWVGAITASLLASAVVAGAIFCHQLSSDRQLLRAIGPYLATLVESQDRPELLRVFQSIAEEREADLVLVQDGVVLASSRNLSEMDRPFEAPRSVAHIFGSNGVDLAGGFLFIRTNLQLMGNPTSHVEVFVFTPVLPALKTTAFTALVTLLVVLALSFLSALRMKKAIRQALVPLDRLHREIRELGNGKPASNRPIQIRELEEIRQTILKTQVSLENAYDRLAEERAKKLSAESYKRMIHDLHTPVAALRQNVRVLTDPASDAAARQEAAESVPAIADQILKQVGSAKKNLDQQPAALCETDVRACIQSSVKQVVASFGHSFQKQIDAQYPDEPVITAHDPDLLQRAIINLIENGAQAAQSRVCVSVRPGSPLTGPAIVVSDDGPGMDDAEVALHLQGRGQSTKMDRQAFGLSSANHIVRTHGGRIIYRKSPELGGASFEIRLGAV